jgi:hypothetical protein
MTSLLKKTLLVAALTAYATSSLAADAIDIPAFSLTSWSADYLNLVSSNDNKYVFAAAQLNVGMAGSGAYPMEMLFDGAVKEGYRITSLSLSGKFMADAWVQTEVPPLGNCNCTISWVNPGSGGSSGNAVLTVAQGGKEEVFSYVNSAGNLNGRIELFELSYNQIITGEFDLGLYAAGMADTRYGYYTVIDGAGSYDISMGASAEMNFSDMKLTVQVEQISAVPEPGTYAMLLAGLGIISFAARRQRA